LQMTTLSPGLNMVREAKHLIEVIYSVLGVASGMRSP
jgi:hypothetical protein